MDRISANALIAAARQQTGLSDFTDKWVIEGLSQLVSSVNRRDDFIAERRSMLEVELIRLLKNNLHFQSDLRHHPEILAQTPTPPLAIVSLPRTGTTKVQRLLGELDTFQNVPYWQIHMPSRQATEYNDDIAQRIQTTRDYCQWIDQVAPEIQKIHRFAADEPEEDLYLPDMSFGSMYLGGMHGSQDYNQWLFENNLVPRNYDFLYQTLQYLQWQFHRNDSRPWLLKSPGHIGFEEQLVRIFPQGVNFLCTHREPVEVIPSLCRLMEYFPSLWYKNARSKEETGMMALAIFSEPMLTHMQWRDRNPQVPILDLSYREICRDSVGTVEKIYDLIELPVDGATIDLVQQWDKLNPQHKSGRNPYSLEEYGLTENAINQVFEKYRARFADYL